MKLIHISDSHFSNDKPVFELSLLRKAFLEFKDVFSKKDTYMVVSGDVTLKGNKDGYVEALTFFNEVWLSNGGDRDRFIACPGNHDYCDLSFSAFDAFVTGIRRDNSLNFSDSSSNIVDSENATFLVLNSSSHGDTKYGYIDMETLREKISNDLTKCSEEKQRIAVVHHNVFGIYKDDSSAIRNSLAFFKILDENKFNVILHGHQHSQTVIKLGENEMEVFSGRSLNFSTPGIVNGMAELTFDGGRWSRENKILSHDHSNTQQLKFENMRA
jgi:3',5'-cyclic AMP phosphodiesterase CpdA